MDEGGVGSSGFSVSWGQLGVVAAVLVVLAAVAVWFVEFKDNGGGGGGPPAASRGSEPVTPSGSRQSKPAPPPLPPEAMLNNEAGAEAFAKYYLELDNYIQRTNDVSPAKKLFDPNECTGCQAVVESQEEIAARGELVRGGEYAVRTTQAQKISDGNYIVAVSYDRTEVHTYDKNGHELGQPVGAVSNKKAYVSLKYREGKWFVLSARPASS